MVEQTVLLPVALLFLSLSNCSHLLCSLKEPTSRVCPEEVRGFWQDEEKPDYLVAIEDQKIIVSFHRQVRKVATILDFSERRLRLCEDGQESTREIISARHKLTIRDPSTGETHHLLRLPNKPEELTLSPLPLPEPSQLTAEKTLQIEEELSRRVRIDQEAQRLRFEQTWEIGAAQPSKAAGLESTGDFDTLNMIAVKADNTKYLKTLVAQVGWIDSRRFGPAAADDAFLLAQHSQDLPLMLAGLPKIKEEVEARHLQGEAYALLYDRTQLLMGEKQRYGTRVGKDSAGYPIVLPTESPETVDERRKELGMSPLSEYVKIFGANGVRFSSACTIIKKLQ